MGARNVIILGENEVNSGLITVKNQQTGEQFSVPRAELAAKLQPES
jgi:histidyl-tRNA synthetase